VRDQLGDKLPRPYDFPRLDGNIAGFAANAAERLMNQEPRVRQALDDRPRGAVTSLPRPLRPLPSPPPLSGILRMVSPRTLR
jgi:hypothetical protein